MPSTAASATNPEFFIDRSLGAVKVRRALENLGYVAHTMNERYGRKHPGTRTKDAVWIADAGSQGELILTKDDIRSPESQIRAMEQAAAKVFYLTNARLNGRDAARWYTNNLEEILKKASKPGPYMYGVFEDHLNPMQLRPPKQHPAGGVQASILGKADEDD